MRMLLQAPFGAGNRFVLRYVSRLIFGLLASLMLIEQAHTQAIIEGPVIAPNVGAPVSPIRRKALELFRRLTGLTTSIDDPRLTEMESKINANDYMGAAAVATKDSAFFNFVVRDFAARMSTRDENVRTQLNDFTATVIGLVRDDVSAQELLTGNFVYRGSAGLANVRADVINDVLKSNNHYADLETTRSNLAQVLERINSQIIIDGAGAAAANPDSAGLLTSRAFLEAHASAGTNRRLVEYTFREFLCTPIEQWADANSSDFHVGRDVDRFPGGSNAKYQSTCKACHANMDALRGAFAQFDFANNVVKNAQLLAAGGAENQMQQNPIGVASKYNQNGSVFPQGYLTRDTTWQNRAINGTNATQFGWRGPATGSGVKQFAQMIAGSKAFSRCMAKRVYQSVCKRDPASFETGAIETWANDFELNNYKLKNLFERIAVSPECIGKLRE